MTKASELEKKIKNWVKENYGIEELENPSWNIDGLVEELCQNNLQYEGIISVDSGTIMVADPCYWIKGNETMSWRDYCDEIRSDSIRVFQHESGLEGKGIMFGNFGGDGLYNVYAEYDDDGFQKRIVIELNDE